MGKNGRGVSQNSSSVTAIHRRLSYRLRYYITTILLLQDVIILIVYVNNLIWEE
jgi:hypothetical protein